MKEEKLTAGWINARVESASEKPEWKAISRGKQPYYIYKKDGGLVAMAGIWEHWESKKILGRYFSNKTLLAINRLPPPTSHTHQNIDYFSLPDTKKL